MELSEVPIPCRFRLVSYVAVFSSRNWNVWQRPTKKKKKAKIVISHGSGTLRFCIGPVPCQLRGRMRPLVKPTWCLLSLGVCLYRRFSNAVAHSQVASFTVLPSSGREFPKVVRDGPLYFLTATFQAPLRGDLMLLGIP